MLFADLHEIKNECIIHGHFFAN